MYTRASVGASPGRFLAVSAEKGLRTPYAAGLNVVWSARFFAALRMTALLWSAAALGEA